MGSTHDSTMPCAPSPIRPARPAAPGGRRRTARCATPPTTACPCATRMVSCDDEHRPPAAAATNSTHADPARRGRPAVVDAMTGGRARRPARRARRAGMIASPTQTAVPVKRPAAGIHRSMPTLRLSWATPANEDERRRPRRPGRSGRGDEPGREDPAEQARDRAHGRADREGQAVAAVVQPVGPPSARGLGGRGPYLHCATTACRSRNGTLTAVSTYSAVAGCQ